MATSRLTWFTHEAQLSVSSENYASALSVDGRYRLLVEASSDYAIYMLDAKGLATSWIVGRNFAVF